MRDWKFQLALDAAYAASEDAQEGSRAFAEQRKPMWNEAQSLMA
jgi:1,4-dihydroxy-2-naphthoyl-CoA synthase